MRQDIDYLHLHVDNLDFVVINDFVYLLYLTESLYVSSLSVSKNLHLLWNLTEIGLSY